MSLSLVMIMMMMMLGLKIARLSKMFLILVCVFESNKWDFSFLSKNTGENIKSKKDMCIFLSVLLSMILDL